MSDPRISGSALPEGFGDESPAAPRQGGSQLSSSQHPDSPHFRNIVPAQHEYPQVLEKRHLSPASLAWFYTNFNDKPDVFGLTDAAIRAIEAGSLKLCSTNSYGSQYVQQSPEGDFQFILKLRPNPDGQHLDLVSAAMSKNGEVVETSTLPVNATTRAPISARMQALPSIPAGDDPDLDIARTVLKDLRSRYYEPNLKSPNKIRTRQNYQLELERWDQAKKALNEVRRAYLPLIRNPDEALPKLELGKAFNCGEISILAVYKLRSANVRAELITIGGQRNTHGFAAILPAGHPPKLDPDMAKWDERIIICDPWMNISCRARDFNHAFVAKMEKWNVKHGKNLLFEGKQIISVDPDWISAVIEGEKAVMPLPELKRVR